MVVACVWRIIDCVRRSRGSLDLPIGRGALKFVSRELTVHSDRPPVGHSRTACPSRRGSCGRCRVSGSQAPIAHHKAFAASEFEPDSKRSVDSRLLHTSSVARTLGQDGCDLEDFDPPASSSSPGEEKISFALQLQSQFCTPLRGHLKKVNDDKIGRFYG
jgi:hypothetical protein